MFSAAIAGKKIVSPSNFGSKSTPFNFALMTFEPTQSIYVVAPGFSPANATVVFTRKFSAPVVRSKSIR